MKYVKIYNEKMQCLGVADIEQNYDKDGYVKLFDATTMKFRGVVDVDDIPESGDNMPVVKVFDENMQPCGVVTADNIRHSDGYLIRLQKDPSTTGSVSGGGRFIAGTSVTVVATPDAQSDYPEFDGWYEGETKVSENASYTFTVSGARTLVAKFKEVQKPLVASVWANEECTVRPTVNSTPNTVYLRIESDVEWPISWGGRGSTSVERDHNSLKFNYDHYEEGGEDVSEYDANVWNDWFSDIVEQKPSVGDVMELSHDGEPATVYDSFVMDFYLEDANE